jgi:hypothetical protein
MTRLWFHARSYGWGWTPATIEGWLVVAAFVAATLINTGVLVYRTRAGSHSRSAMLAFLLAQAVCVGLVIAICWMTGERPRWRWGNQ